VSDPARELLRTAAVAGNSFSAGVVAQMLNVSVLTMLGPLDEARAAGFLVAGDRPGDHRFSHALVRSAVTTGLSAAEKRRLHSAAADAIEALYEGQLDVRLAETARHRVEASLPGDRALAVAACEAAADVAAGSLAYEEAVRLYRQALSVGGEEIGEADCSRLELALAAALYRSGDLPGSQQTAVRVARRAERRRDRLWLARTALVMEAIGVPEWDGEICRVCEQALAGDDLGGDLRARVSSRYAQALVYRGEYDRAGKVSLDALAAAGSADDPVALVDALRARQLACSAPDGIAERAVLASRMLEVADTMGSAWLEMWGRLWRIDTLFETGQLRGVQRELADLENCLERLPGPLGRWHFLHTVATLALATGRYTEAVRLARESFTLFNDMGHPIAFGAYAAILFQAGLQIGFDRSGAVELFGQIPDHLRPDAVDTTRGAATVFPALSSAMICLHQGDRTGAGTAYAQAGPVRSWNPSAAMRMSCWATGLAVAIGLGRAEDIEFLAARFEPFRGQHVANGAGAGGYMGPVELPLGRAAAAPGQLDTAADDLQSAIAICDANGARGCAVQARVELAAALTHRQAQGDPNRARAELDAAAGEAQRLGMVPFTEQIEHLRARLPAVAAASSPLSPRELEVARLVARGLTNKQIGQTLYVSERTAENHVQHILIKLAFRNRSQIAAWASGEPGADHE
jgi:DNA-binding CsgD family transcriptional regulator